MNKEVITNKQGIAIIVLFEIGSAIVLSPGSEAKQDVWLAILLAMLLAVPAILIYSRLLSNYPGMDLFDILNKVLGKVPGKIIALIYTWYAFHLGALVIRNFSEFIQTVSLPETPQLIIALFIGVICIWIVKAGIEVFGRWAWFFLPVLLVFILGFSALTLTEADVNNIKPVLYNGISPVINSAFGVFSFPFAEMIVFTMVFRSVKNRFNVYKVCILGLLIGTLILLIASVRNIVVLGAENTLLLNFPSYSAVSMVEVGAFLQRIEILVSVVFLLAGIVKTGVCLYAACYGAARIFDLGNYRPLAAPVGFLMMNLSIFIYSNTMEMFEFALKIYKYYALPFQVIIPVIILIVAEIKLRTGGREKTS